MSECDCTDEYGPCELHGQTMVQREGSALRTADELSWLFVLDARTLGAQLSPYGEDVIVRCRKALDANESHGVAWLNDAELHDELMTVLGQIETELATLGYLSYWADGFRIVRPSDCPLN